MPRPGAYWIGGIHVGLVTITLSVRVEVGDRPGDAQNAAETLAEILRDMEAKPDVWVVGISSVDQTDDATMKDQAAQTHDA